MRNLSKWTLVFDADKCNGCNNCTIATRDEYLGNAFPGYAEAMPLHGHRWLDLRMHERGQAPVVDITYYPVMCQHCEDPPCAKVGVVHKRPDGIVIVDPIANKGVREIIDACPFNAIYWNEEKEIPQHWNFDAHLLDGGWAGPRCVQACPTGAMAAVQLSDAEYDALLRRGEAVPLAPESEAKPRVLYKGIGPLRTEFVSGTLVQKTSSGEYECVAGLSVQVRNGSDVVGTAVSDSFGDFKIDGVDCSRRPQELTVVVDAPRQMKLEIKIIESIYLGRIELLTAG